LGRIGWRPFTSAEVERLFMGPRGLLFKVTHTGSVDDRVR